MGEDDDNQGMLKIPSSIQITTRPSNTVRVYSLIAIEHHFFHRSVICKSACSNMFHSSVNLLERIVYAKHWIHHDFSIHLIIIRVFLNLLYPMSGQTHLATQCEGPLDRPVGSQPHLAIYIDTRWCIQDHTGQVINQQKPPTNPVSIPSVLKYIKIPLFFPTSRFTTQLVAVGFPKMIMVPQNFMV